MAWIKMRSDLSTHPKVVRIASALKADRMRVIGGLHAVWCLFDAHSVDGILSGYTPDALDDLVGWAGFAAAMIDVSWLENDGQSLSTPDFDEHNSQSAKRRAQEADRKRVDRKTSASEADKKRTREEKRREEKELKSKTTTATPSALPEWVPAESWDAFVAMRKAIKKPLTAGGVVLAIQKLDNLRSSGHDPRGVLEQSTMSNWQGLFEIRATQQFGAKAGKDGKFNFAGVDRSGDQAAQAASMAKHGITIPDGEVEI